MTKILDKSPPIPTRRLLLCFAQRLLLCLIFILSLSWYLLNPLTQIVDKILKWRPQKNILEVAIFIIIIFKSKLWQPHLHPPPKKKKTFGSGCALGSGSSSYYSVTMKKVQGVIGTECWFFGSERHHYHGGNRTLSCGYWVVRRCREVCMVWGWERADPKIVVLFKVSSVKP